MVIARHKLRLVLATSLIIIAVAGWLGLDNRQEDLSPTAFATQTDIDFFIQNAQFKTFGADGQISSKANTPKIEHFKQTQHSVAQPLNIGNYQNGIIQSSISANKATAYDQQESIIFQQNVVVTAYQEQQPQNFLKTQSLTYHRSKQTITSKDDVEFTDRLGSIITANGLFSDINLRTLNLQHNVKGTINVQ